MLKFIKYDTIANILTVIGAQYQLGALYQESFLGVGKNEKETARLFRLSADKGVAGAQTSLAEMYKDGIVVEKDL